MIELVVVLEELGFFVDVLSIFFIVLDLDWLRALILIHVKVEGQRCCAHW